MEVGIVKEIVNAIRQSPKSINQIAESVGIGWKTCEKYLESLKMLGIVEETKIARERMFSFRVRRRRWLYSHARKIVDNIINRSPEKYPMTDVSQEEFEKALEKFCPKMEESVSILDSKDRRLLLETRNLIEELLETLDAMSNPDEVARVKEAEVEVRDGKGRPLSELRNKHKKRKKDIDNISAPL